MTFGSKLKKLRTENDLTQDELAEKLLVTRTAVSKWETDKGFPNIDSLKLIANTFGITIDELISDEDMENSKILEKKEAQKFYMLAMIFLLTTIAAALLGWYLKLPALNYVGTLSMVGYVVCAVLSKPKYKRMESRKFIIPYILGRLVLLGVILFVIISAFL